MGVAGRIAEVYEHTSKVLFVTEELSAVACTVGEGWDGLAEGRGGPVLQLNYVSEQADLRVGQRVLSSETSATFPAGLPVGSVVEVLPPDPVIAMKSARVAPAAGIGRLREVMVLVKDRSAAASGTASP